MNTDLRTARAYAESDDYWFPNAPGTAPALRRPVIEGLLREGETMAIENRTGRTGPDLAIDLAIAVAAGKPWMNAFSCVPGNVLLVDHQLHVETIVHRVKAVRTARGVPLDQIATRLAIADWRNDACDLDDWTARFSRLRIDNLSMVVFDAFDWLPILGKPKPHAIANWVDSLGVQLQCAVAMVNGPDRLGLGEYADTQLTLNPVRGKQTFRLTGEARTWPRPRAVALRWSDPVWTAVCS